MTISSSQVIAREMTVGAYEGLLPNKGIGSLGGRDLPVTRRIWVIYVDAPITESGPTGDSSFQGYTFTFDSRTHISLGLAMGAVAVDPNILEALPVNG